jgi:hypothetical protein
VGGRASSPSKKVKYSNNKTPYMDRGKWSRHDAFYCLNTAIEPPTAHEPHRSLAETNISDRNTKKKCVRSSRFWPWHRHRVPWAPSPISACLLPTCFTKHRNLIIWWRNDD